MGRGGGRGVSAGARGAHRWTRGRLAQHVGVRPAAGLREPALCPLHRRLQVADDGRVRRAHVARRAEVVPRAPRRVRHRAAPVAVLDEDRLARRVKERRVLVEVALRAAAVELDRVEAVVERRVDVALVARVRRAVVRADAVVAVPLRRGGGGGGWGWEVRAQRRVGARGRAPRRPRRRARAAAPPRRTPAVSPTECAYVVMLIKSGKRSVLTTGRPSSLWYVYFSGPYFEHSCQLSSRPTSE